MISNISKFVIFTICLFSLLINIPTKVYADDFENKEGANSQINIMRTKLNEAIDENIKLSNELDDLREKIKEEKSNSKATRDSAKEEIKALKQKVSGSDLKADSAQKELEKLKNVYKKERKELKDQLNSSEEKIKLLNEKLAEEEVKTKELQNKLDAGFKKEKTELLAAIESCVLEKENAKKNLELSRERVKELENWILSKDDICSNLDEPEAYIEKDRFIGRYKISDALEDTPEIKEFVKERADIKAGLDSKAKETLDEHYNLGIFYGKAGMYFHEEREYLECLKINPDDADVHYNLAILYDDYLNDNKKAIEQYKEYLRLRPTGEDVVNVKKWMLEAEEEMRMGVHVK